MPVGRARPGKRSRITVALVIPFVAVAASLAAAGIATGASARNAAATPSDGVQPPGGGVTRIEPPIVPPNVTTTRGGDGTGTGTRTGSPTGSPTPTPTATGQTSPGAPGVPAVPPGGTGALCASAPTGTPTSTASPTGTGTATGSPTGTANPARPTTVTIGQAGGKSNVLVDQNGCALYLNINDTSTSSACDASCETSWPPAVGPGQAGTSVDAQNLSTFTRQNGVTQVTYFGHQLYYNIADTAPGQANGQGVNQTWYLVGQNGEPVRN